MISTLSNLQKRDLNHIWHPCSQMKDYEDFPPIVILGNPLACRVALEVLHIFEEDHYLEKNRVKSTYMKNLASQVFNHHPYVGEYRQTGMVGAIELVKNKVTKEPFPSEERIGYKIYQLALEKGLLLRPLGNVLYFMPPYVITDEEINTMILTTNEVIQHYFENIYFNKAVLEH
jgi:adenosylmethionine---8-amino-7-oxononanoate aminotransferase